MQRLVRPAMVVQAGTVPVLRNRAARLLNKLGVAIDDHGAGPGGTALQVAALPYRVRDGALDVLLVTSRRSRRWILPKGWPAHGQALHESAAREAYEEAGVRGAIGREAIGRFSSPKSAPGRAASSPPVLVFPLRVDTELASWPEQHQRKRQWFGHEQALAAIADEQRAVLASFHPAVPAAEA